MAFSLDIRQGRSGGSFWAAPRRTGKSTFVRQDLVPTLLATGAEFIYLDLWTDRTQYPALRVANSMWATLADGLVAWLAA